MPRTALDFATLRQRAEEASRDFLENRWSQYLAMVRDLEDHPENQSGVDKSWVESLLSQSRAHYRAARQVDTDAGS